MTKVIKVQDSNYGELLKILHDLERERNKRMSFDDVISFLISIYNEKRKNLRVNKVT